MNIDMCIDVDIEMNICIYMDMDMDMDMNYYWTGKFVQFHTLISWAAKSNKIVSRYKFSCTWRWIDSKKPIYLMKPVLLNLKDDVPLNLK